MLAVALVAILLFQIHDAVGAALWAARLAIRPAQAREKFIAVLGIGKIVDRLLQGGW